MKLKNKTLHLKNKSLSLGPKFEFSSKHLTFFGVIFASLGAYIVYQSFAAGPLHRTNYDSSNTSLWAEHGEQVKDPSRIDYVSDSARGKVQKVEVWPGDNNVAGSGSGERAEVINTKELKWTDNQTMVMSWSLYIDNNFASPSGGWNNFTQVHASGGGNQAAWQMNLVGDSAELKMRIYGGGNWIQSGQPTGSIGEWFSAGLLPKNQWHDFVVEVKFSCNGAGYAKVWRNNTKIMDVQNRKIGYCGDPGMYWKQGFYRAAYTKTTKLLFDDTFRWGSSADAFTHYGWSSGTAPAQTPPPPSQQTGSQLRFPASGHVWGGNSPTAMQTHDLVIVADMSQGNPNQARANGNPNLIAFSNSAVEPNQSDYRARRSFSFTYGGGLKGGVIDGLSVSPWSGVNDTLSPNPQGAIRGWQSNDFGCMQADNIPGYAIHKPGTAEFIKKAAYYSWKIGKGSQNGWNGIWSDNLVPGNLIKAGWFYGSGCTIDNAAWDTGFKSIVNGLRSLGVPYVGGNTAFKATDSTVRASTNTSMHEVLEFTIKDGPTAYASLLNEVQAWQNAGSGPKVLIVLHKTPSTDIQGMRLGLGMATIMGGAYMPYQSHSDLYLPAEMKKNGQRNYLGLPTGSPTRSGDVWKRTFEQGTVYVNLGAVTASVDGVSIPPKDAVFSSTTSTTTPPPPPPPSSSFSVTHSIASGSTITGNLKWEASPSGKTVSKVEFFIDGALKSTENLSPYIYGGDTALLDTTKITNGTHNFSVTATASDGSKTSSSVNATVSNTQSTTASGNGLSAIYHNNIDFTGTSLSKVEPTINFSYPPTGVCAPSSGIGCDTFSARWTGKLLSPKTEIFTFYTDSDDGIRLWINDALIINNWTNHAVTTNSAKVSLSAGTYYKIKLEYYENTGNGVAKLYWSSPSIAKQIVPKANLFSK